MVQKKIKIEKKISAAKLPGLLKKTYTKEKFEKKILKHIYIDTDRKLITGQFKDDSAHPGQLCIPSGTELSKQDFKRLKLVAKQIKSQKGRIRLVPLAAVIVFCAAIGITVTLFKNVFVKRALIQGMESAFGAKTDIASVDLQIFGASLKINGLQQADKNSPMKNLFQIDNITFDFNLTELLRGKFDAQNMAVTGVALGTARKTSGVLPEKKIKKTAVKQDSAFAKAVSAKAGDALKRAEASLKDTFSQYNPETVIAGLNDKLQSPKAAEDIQKKVEQLIPEWKDKPAEFEASINTLSSDAQELINTDWSKINDAAQLTAALEKTQKVIDESKTLKASTETAAAKLKTDTADVRRLSSELQKAVGSDKALVQAELNKITSFKLSDGKKLLGDALDSAAYGALGKYYPYMQQAVAYSLKMKNTSGTKPQQKAKKARRSSGRTVYYKADRVPSFLIEKMAASGTAFSADAEEISNNQDLRGAPASVHASAQTGTISHKLQTVIDVRSASKAPLITADYSGSGFTVDMSTPVLAIKSAAALNGEITADENGGFTADIACTMKNMQLTSESFEPEFAYNIYTKALSSITEMNMKVKAAYSKDGGISLALDTDADRQIAASLKNLMNSELASIKADAQKQVSALLSEKTKCASDSITQYLDIDRLLSGDFSSIDTITKQLQNQQTEIKKQIQDKAGKQVKDAAADAAKKLLNGLF